jgi:hypothetical protein
VHEFDFPEPVQQGLEGPRVGGFGEEPDLALSGP